MIHMLCKSMSNFHFCSRKVSARVKYHLSCLRPFLQLLESTWWLRNPSISQQVKNEQNPCKNVTFYISLKYICYVNDCKFSTSTHAKYHIVQNMISAICGYFYGSWGPTGRSEIACIVKSFGKKEPNMALPLVSECRDISRHIVTSFAIFRMHLSFFRTFFQYMGDF